MQKPSQKSLDAFYNAKRLAIIGVSRSKGDYSRRLYSDLRARGCEVVPVNPHATEIDGVACHASIKDVGAPVEGAIILLPSDKVDAAVAQCAEAGVKRVWVHQVAAGKLKGLAAPALCAEKGIDYVSGVCPFMFMPGNALPHRFHGNLVKLFGGGPI